MDMRRIKQLIALIKQTGVAEIEIKEGEESVRITLDQHFLSPFSKTAHPPVTVPLIAEEKEKERGNADLSSSAVCLPLPDQGRHIVYAPMVGTLYLAPVPGAQSFVEQGQPVKAGETICLIEAMKMFNPIEADKAGVIMERLVENGMPVEFGQPLFVIEETI